MKRTLVENIAHRTVVQDHHFAQIGFYRTEIFDVRPVAQRAVLSVVPRLEVLALLLEPVDYRIGILLNTSREDDKFIPLADLPQELIAVRALVDVVQDRVLRCQRGLRPVGCQGSGHGHGKLNLHHVAAGHASALGERVDEGLIEIQHQGLLGELGIARSRCV